MHHTPLLIVALASLLYFVAGYDATVNLSALNGTDGFGLSLNTSTYTSIYLATGDINADNIADLIVTAVDVTAPYTSLYVLFGSNETFHFQPNSIVFDYLDGQQGFEVRGTEKYFGDLAASGDVDGDGIDDIITCAGYSLNEAGQCYIIFGSARPFPTLIMESDIIGKFGFAIQGAIPGAFMGAYSLATGDVNGDKLADVIIGTPKPRNGSGDVYVWYGTPKSRAYPNGIISVSQLDGTNGFTVQGPNPPQPPLYIGATSGLASGDINGDGYDDIIIGTDVPNHYFGRVYVVYGSRSPASAVFLLEKIDIKHGFVLNGEGGWLGFSVGAGDVNGDGIVDLFAGAIHADSEDTGRVYVVYGSRSQPPLFPENVTVIDGTNGFTVQGVEPSTGFGWGEVAPDLNGDGFGDLSIGAPLDTTVRNNEEGIVYVVFGQKGHSMPAFLDLETTPSDGSNGFRAVAHVERDNVGVYLASGDINGDGFGDLLVAGNSNVYVIFGGN